MIQYEDNFGILLYWKGSVIPRAVLHALPGPILAFLLCFLKEYVPEVQDAFGMGETFSKSSMWNAMTAVIGILAAFRIRQALGRFWEGTSLLHQMRGEWFDVASCVVTFSRQARQDQAKIKEVDDFRHTFVRLMSLMHGSALDEISGHTNDNFDVIDVRGLDTQTLRIIKDCQNRNSFSKVEILQHLIQVLVTANYHSGVLTIPPPILSRVYQTLSRGFVNLLNARKIKDTFFPLPFVQTIRILLLFHTFFTPIVMSEIADNYKAWAALFTFIPLLGLQCINIAAWELEMPFGSDVNDLPMHVFQQEMNDALLMLVDSGADHLPSVSQYAEDLAAFSFRAASEKESKSKSLESDGFFVGRNSCHHGHADITASSTSSVMRSSFFSGSNSKSIWEPGFFDDRKVEAPTFVTVSEDETLGSDTFAGRGNIRGSIPYPQQKSEELHSPQRSRRSRYDETPAIGESPRKLPRDLSPSPAEVLAECMQSVCASWAEHVARMLRELEDLWKQSIASAPKLQQLMAMSRELKRNGEAEQFWGREYGFV